MKFSFLFLLSSSAILATSAASVKRPRESSVVGLDESSLLANLELALSTESSVVGLGESLLANLEFPLSTESNDPPDNVKVLPDDNLRKISKLLSTKEKVRFASTARTMKGVVFWTLEDIITCIVNSAPEMVWKHARTALEHYAELAYAESGKHGEISDYRERKYEEWFQEAVKKKYFNICKALLIMVRRTTLKSLMEATNALSLGVEVIDDFVRSDRWLNIILEHNLNFSDADIGQFQESHDEYRVALPKDKEILNMAVLAIELRELLYIQALKDNVEDKNPENADQLKSTQKLIEHIVNTLTYKQRWYSRLLEALKQEELQNFMKHWKDVVEGSEAGTELSKYMEEWGTKIQAKLVD